MARRDLAPNNMENLDGEKRRIAGRKADYIAALGDNSAAWETARIGKRSSI